MQESASRAPRRVAICVYRGFIEPACEAGLRELERNDWVVWREPGSAALDRERSRLATAALDAGFDALLWIDADQTFTLANAEALDRSGEPFVATLIARRTTPDFACVFLEETRTVCVGEGGGLLKARYVGCGFTLVRRSALEAVAKHYGLPRVLDPAGAIVPFYLPMVTQLPGQGLAYLSEDYAFCERLRQAGIDVLVDTRQRIGHLGQRCYQWEDVLTKAAAKSTFTFDVLPHA